MMRWGRDVAQEGKRCVIDIYIRECSCPAVEGLTYTRLVDVFSHSFSTMQPLFVVRRAVAGERLVVRKCGHT